MTEELKQLREALRRVKHEAASLADAQVIALEALTQRPAAQEVAGINTREQIFQSGYRIGRNAERASLPTPPAAQTTRTTADTLREIKAASCKDCGASGYTDPGEADSPDGPGRPAVVCGSCMGTGWRDGVHISDQQATPEPVGEQATVPRDAYDALERERDYWRTRARAMIDHAEGTCWYWMGDGEDHLESLVNSLPVVIRADQLRELLTRPAPGVPEGFALTRDDFDRCREWFDCIQDVHGSYLDRHDYELAEKLYTALGMRVPNSINDRLTTTTPNPPRSNHD